MLKKDYNVLVCLIQEQALGVFFIYFFAFLHPETLQRVIRKRLNNLLYFLSSWITLLNLINLNRLEIVTQAVSNTTWEFFLQQI